MSLRERLSGEQAALQAQKLEAQKSEQEQTLAPVRTRIAQIEDAQKDLTELRSQIGTDLESFLGSVKTFKGRSDQIDKLRQEFADVLTEKGVSSKGDFVEGEDFQEEQEVQDYKAAKVETGTKAAKVREVVGKVKEVIPDLTTRTKDKAKNRWEKNSPKVWNERVSAVIEDRIKELDRELANLKLQTPEGQVERQQQYRERVQEKITKSHLNFASAEGPRQLDQMRIPDTKDLDEAKVIGEDSTKRILGEAYTAKVEADFDKSKQTPERADVRRLMEYRGKLDPIQKVVRDVENQRRMVLSNLEQFDKTDEKFRDRLSRYGSSKVDKYFDHLEELALGFDIKWTTVTETLSRAQATAQSLDNGRNTQELFRSDYGSYGETAPTSIPDLDSLLSQANRYLEFYTKLATQLQPENFPMNDDARKALEVKGGGYDRSVKRLMKIDSKLKKELTQRPFIESRDRVVKQDQEDDKQKEKLAGLIPDKVNADWSELRQQIYQRDNNEIARLAGDIERQKQQALVVLKELIGIRGKFDRQPDLRVRIRQNDSRSSWEQQYYVDSVDFEAKRDQIASQLDTSRKELETLQRNIRDKRQEISKAWRKGKLEQELVGMEEQEKQLQVRIEQLQKDSRQAYEDLVEPVSGLGKILGSIKLEQGMVGQTMTAKELLDRLSHLDGTLPDLTDEQKSKIAEYNSLKQSADEAKKRYEVLKQSK